MIRLKKFSLVMVSVFLAACLPQEMMNQLNSALAPQPTFPPGTLTEMDARGRSDLIGQSVGGRIAREGEIDEFTFMAEAGQRLVVYLAVPQADRGEIVLRILEIDSFSGVDREISRVVNRRSEAQPSGVITINETGTYKIRVHGDYDWAMGSYVFQIRAIDNAPEHIPAEVSIGEVIRGEDIRPEGDVDEFTFMAEAGQRLVVYLAVPQADRGEIVLRVLEVDPTSGAERQIGRVDNGRSEAQPSGVITINETGTHKIRVHGDYDWAMGSYVFQIRPATQ